MILYKYRSLANFEYVLDIILNQRLHCSTYDKLNDPFEGLFYLLGSYKRYSSKTRICSLSSNLNDVRLWSYYADGHKGIVLAIDLSGLESKSYKVDYFDTLPSGGSSLATQIPLAILRCKTKHWVFESEYRIMDESEHLEEGKYFSIKGRIKAIYLGTRTSEPHRKLLSKIVPSEIPLYTTRINEKKNYSGTWRMHPRTKYVTGVRCKYA